MAKRRGKNRFKSPSGFLWDQNRRRRKREIALIFVILGFVAFLTYLESRIITFGGDFPISNTILMFILININLLLLILLIFLVFRNLFKLLYDRRRKVMGTRLRTRLVLAFISLTLLPTTVLFFFSIHFITTSIEFWFNVPIEQALENSLQVGRQLYHRVETQNRFLLERIAYQIRTRDYLDPDQQEGLANYIQVVQKEFNIQGVEVYDRNARRLYVALSPELDALPFEVVFMGNLRKDLRDRPIRSFSQNTVAGELNRTIGAIPFGAKGANAEGFIVLSNLISPDLAENLASISRGYEEYQQIKLLKRPIQVTYYITLSIVALLVLFCAIWFGFYLAKSISVPIQELAEGTRRIAEGDLGFSLTAVGDDEIGSLVESFNRMTRDLRANRDQLELSARMLRQQNIEIEERRRYMEIVLRNISTGVITLDAKGFVITANKSAERMLNLQAEEILGRSYKRLLDGKLLGLAEEIREKIDESPEDAAEMPVRLTISGRPRSFMTHVNVLRDDAGNHIGLVIVFDDLTDQEKAQRMAAWREVARRIAHEVKNPLTPITLSAQRLKRKYSSRIDESVFTECIHMIIDHVELIRNLVNEFSTFARFPAANPRQCALVPIIEETIALYREGHPEIRFALQTPENPVLLNLDRQQIKQAMINLADNAISAMKGKGRITFTLTHEPALKTVRLEVADTGPGISHEDKTRLFEPYFSTKKSGMGLGLTIVSTIIADHNGMIRVQDNHPFGTKFIIEFPV
jgi:two-component system, NtrC family, nitrogen regulation sensor histidine kinase NtrY